MFVIISFSAIFILNIETANGAYIFSFKWGTPGSGNGQLQGPVGIDIDSSDNVYVVDNQNNRVQKFLLANPCPEGTSQVVTGVCFVTMWGTLGSGNEQFNSPIGIAVDSSGNVFVSDMDNHRIQKFTNTGTFIRSWGNQGTGDTEFNFPGGITVDSSGNVFVSDNTNHRIQKFTNNGMFIRAWGNQGTADGEFNFPRGIDVDSSDNVFVIDGNNKIQKFTNTGTFIRSWGQTGFGDGEFRDTSGLSVDSMGNVYGIDWDLSKIQKFTNTGTFITKWLVGDNPGERGDIQNLVTSGNDLLSQRVFVTDNDDDSVRVFTWNPNVNPVMNGLENSTKVTGFNLTNTMINVTK